MSKTRLKGDSEFASLQRADQQRLLFFERRAIMLWHHQFQLRELGLMPDASWRESVWIIKTIGRRQAVREAWRLFGMAFDPNFQDFVNDTFAIADNEMSEDAKADIL